MRAKVRLYVRQPLGAVQPVPLSREQAHYLFGVMRLRPGDSVALFNGTDGEWTARVEEAGKRGGTLVCEAQAAPQSDPLDVWLLFAPIKKTRTDFIVEKATELGVRRILPVGTDYTNSERVRQDRLQAHAIEAAEQCGATAVPEVDDLVPLARLLQDWPSDRRLMFCDERAGPASCLPAGVAADDGLGDVGPWAVLIGPEGGFSDTERARLADLALAHPVSLGPRILRADTAAVAALVLWQTTFGDWR